MGLDKPIPIEIAIPKLRYQFTIDSKYTIIRGDSSTGKTTLVRLIEAGVARIESGGLNIARLPMPNIFGWDKWVEGIMSLSEDTLLYADESDLEDLSLEIEEVLVESSALYLLITRDTLNGIPPSQKNSKVVQCVSCVNGVTLNRLV